jgi:hypothetical protein
LHKIYARHKELIVTPSKYIKHNRFLDICFAVYSVDRWSESIVLSGEWYNQGQVSPYRMGRFEIIQIMDKDFSNWLETNDTDFRKAKWVPVKIQ